MYIYIYTYISADPTKSACSKTLAFLISHILYLILTFIQSHNLLLSYLVSCILKFRGNLKGGIISAPPNPSKLRFWLLKHTYILTHLLYLLTILMRFIPYTRPQTQILSGAIWSYLELSGAIWRYLELPGATWSYLELPGAAWRELYHKLVCTHKCLSGAIWSYLQISGAV